MGFALARKYLGIGMATEAACAVIDWTLQQSEYERIEAFWDAENSVSANVLKKKPGYDYSVLDSNGLIVKGTAVHERMVIIGKATKDPNDEDLYIDARDLYAKKS